jgi:tetratricopeptide (TPR) repeat protein
LKQDRDTVALDYYLSGLKINPSHLGCIYNVGCCHYFTKKFANAEKWFSLAIKLDPCHLDSYIGKTVSCIKLGRYLEALDTVDIVFKW